MIKGLLSGCVFPDPLFSNPNRNSQYGGFAVSFQFLSTYPEALYHVVTLSITSATGQLFIFYTIKKFGPIIFTIIMTTRQMVSLVFSAVW